MSKTNRTEKTTPRKPHPKRYTDPITGKALKTLGRMDVDKYIEIELQFEEELEDATMGR